jgi:hypothetical protein
MDDKPRSSKRGYSTRQYGVNSILPLDRECVHYALGFSTGDDYGDAVLFRERFEEWRWRSISSLKNRRLLP